MNKALVIFFISLILVALGLSIWWFVLKEDKPPKPNEPVKHDDPIKPIKHDDPIKPIKHDDPIKPIKHNEKSKATCGSYTCPNPLVRQHHSKDNTRCVDNILGPFGTTCVDLCCGEKLEPASLCSLTKPWMSSGGSHCVDKKVCSHSGRAFESKGCANSEQVCCYVPSGRSGPVTVNNSDNYITMGI